MDTSRSQRREVALYLDHAHRMLDVAARNFDDAFFASAVNRAYYSIFYAATPYCLPRGWLAASTVA